MLKNKPLNTLIPTDAHSIVQMMETVVAYVQAAQAQPPYIVEQVSV